MQKLRIALDPGLKERFGPEIGWTWRLLLTGIGFAWEEVGLDDPEYDIAYTADLKRSRRSRLCVLANERLWERREDCRLERVGRDQTWAYPIFQGEREAGELFEVIDGHLVCARDLVFDLFWLATGQEERYWPRNKHGHFDLGGTVFQREQVLRLALGSGIGIGLERVLRELGCGDPVPRWPDGKQAAACASHDVDYPEVIRWLEPVRIVGRLGASGLSEAVAVWRGKKDNWHFSSWVEMERHLHTRSAFYFVGRQGSLLEYLTGTPDPFYDVRSERFKQLFKYLADEGFEIGMHASYRAFESRERFAAEKEMLEAASGQRIRGNRHHYWRMNPEDPEATLLIHEQIGLDYDTSLTNDRYVGWRRGFSWPFFPFYQKGRRELKTLQIPTAWMDDHLFGYQQDNPGDRCEVLQTLADTAAEQQGCLLIDVHSYVFDGKQYPGWAAAYRWLWEYLLGRSDFWLATPGQVAEHWMKRYDFITRASQGLMERAEPLGLKTGLEVYRAAGSRGLMARLRLLVSTFCLYLMKGGPELLQMALNF